MRVGVIQSNYIPWRGYFDFVNSVDLFVFYDDVAFSTGSWRNRNRLKTADGTKWITVPVKKHMGQTIDETAIEYGHPWIEQHRGLLKSSLGRCPHYREASALWERGVVQRPSTISELNVALIQIICEYLGIRTPLILSRTLGLSGSKTDRLIQLLTKVGATSYLSGPAAKDYLDEQMFRERGISLEYKSYDYGEYPQLFPPFEGTVSVLDLIANLALEARQHLASRSANVRVA